MGIEEGAFNGSSVLDKATSTLDGGNVATICHSFQLQNTESFPSKIMTGHHQDPHRPSSDGAAADDDEGGGDRSRPTPNHNGANKMPSTNEHNVCSDATLLPGPPPATGGAAVVRTLQPFDISTNSPGGMAAALGFPFTWAQWKELEMQAMIYKYMASAIPVPPDLLLSICTISSGASHSASHTTSTTGSVQGQRYTNIRDLEPGRCKRTDGKKWRCSRDVAPHQKYCERHMHRGRPRSRKHVEGHADVSNTSDNKKNRLHPAPLESTPMVVPILTPAGQINSPSTNRPRRSTFQQIQGPLLFQDKMWQKISTDPSFNELHRNLSWMMEGELIAKADAGQQWQQLMDSNAGFSADLKIHPDLPHCFREEALNLLACRDLERAEDASVKHNSEFDFMINPELISLCKQSVKETPRDLINAWSDDNVYNNSNNENMEASLCPSQGNISPSSLTLSIAMAAGDDQHKSWENSWVPFAFGGPLAEVLHPSSINLGENQTSPYTSNGDSISPAATTVSSPSGVLQKTLFSHSDSSVCNSPILAASTNTSETVQFQWPS